MTSRRRVYVIGAGFSAGLGFPVTKELLPLALSRMTPRERSLLRRIINFHFPTFRADDFETYPNIEDLLTKIKVNVDLFRATREREGRLRLKHLQAVERNLLYQLAVLFHKILDEMGDPEWLRKFIAHVNRNAATIISFN